MSLTVPDTYKTGNINENWVVQLTHDNNKCLNLDGTNDKVSFGDAGGLYTSFTLEAWVYPTSATSDNTRQYVIYRGINDDDTGDEANNINFAMYLKRNSSGDTYFQLGHHYQYGSGSNSNVRVATNLVEANKWFHIAVVRDDSDNTIKRYVNGELNSTATTVTDAPTGGGNGELYLGSSEFDSDYFFEGKIAHPRIWNVARSQAEIKRGMNNSVPPDSSGLQGYWKLNEGSGSTVDDLTSSNNNGTISGATWEQTAFNEFITDIGIAFKDTTLDNKFYHGAILNKPSIRDSINLKDSSAKTSGVSLTIANVTLNGEELYKKVIYGDNNFINKDVRIFSQPSNNSDSSNCLQIYHGRLTNFDMDENGELTMGLESKKPWDTIVIPQTKTATTSQYVPIVYGDYTVNTYGGVVRDMSKALFPVPILRIADPNLLYILPRSISDTRPHYYESTMDAFVPIDTNSRTAATYDNSTTFDSNANIGELSYTLKRSFKTHAVSTTGSDGHSNSHRLLLTSSAGSMMHSVAGEGSGTNVAETYFNFPAINGKITELDLLIKAAQHITINTTGGGTSNISIINRVYYGDNEREILGDSLDGLAGTSGNTNSPNIPFTTSGSFTGYTDYINFDFKGYYESNYYLPAMRIKTTQSWSTGNYAGTAFYYDMLFHYVVELDFGSGYEDGEQSAHSKTSYKILEDLEFLYCGNDGLLNSCADTTTMGSSTITKGLHAHRDLLARFTGYDEPDSSIYNWSNNLNVNSLRSAWNLRWWLLEPEELEKILQQMQKEFAFIFKWRADGSGSYWAIKDSYSSSDVAVTLNSSDIKSLDISHTPYSELMTKYEIEYEKHPAVDRYFNSITSEDTTNDVRSKYNIGTKENINKISLEMNINKPGNTDVGAGGSDPNDGYADYYMNLFGDIKKIIKCEVINPSKAYTIETGDVIQFSNTAGEMPVQPFGGDWSNYYMVTSTTRRIGSTVISCREIK